MPNNIDRPNIPDDDYKRNLVRRIEGIYSEKESEKGAYLKKCQDFNARVDDILEEAKNKGIPKKSLKGILKLRELDRKKEALVEALEDDQHEILKSIEEALGEYADTPLGAAAVSSNNKATVGTAGPTTVEKGSKARGSKAREQDETTASIVGAVLASEPDKTGKGVEITGQTNVEVVESELVPGQADIEDAAKEAERKEIEEQRKRDAEAFDAKPPEPAKSDNVAVLDPAKARANRTGGRTKATEASAAMKAAEATSEKKASGPAEGLKIVGAEPGAIKF